MSKKSNNKVGKARKRRSKRRDPDVVYADEYDHLIGKPKIINVNGVLQFDWPKVHVKPTIDGRGNGVFNKDDESVNGQTGAKSLIYVGTHYDLLTDEGKRRFESAKKHSVRDCRADYLAVAKWAKDEHGEFVPVAVLDAYPKLYEKKYGSNAPKFAWIGSLVNEASEGELPNCKLEEYHGPLPDYGKFINVKEGSCVVVTPIRDIPPGGQWLTEYSEL